MTDKEFSQIWESFEKEVKKCMKCKSNYITGKTNDKGLRSVHFCFKHKTELEQLKQKYPKLKSVKDALLLDPWFGVDKDATNKYIT
jgi:hypothetical protein